MIVQKNEREIVHTRNETQLLVRNNRCTLCTSTVEATIRHLIPSGQQCLVLTTTAKARKTTCHLWSLSWRSRLSMVVPAIPVAVAVYNFQTVCFRGSHALRMTGADMTGRFFPLHIQKVECHQANSPDSARHPFAILHLLNACCGSPQDQCVFSS